MRIFTLLIGLFLSVVTGAYAEFQVSAGANQIVKPTDIVTLDGSVSSTTGELIPELSYTWFELDGVLETSILDGPNPTFVAPDVNGDSEADVKTVNFILLVIEAGDGGQFIGASQVQIIVKKKPATAGKDKSTWNCGRRQHDSTDRINPRS